MRRGAVLFAIVTLVAMGFSAGMTAVADEYRVTVTYGDHTQRTTVEVLPAPASAPHERVSQ